MEKQAGFHQITSMQCGMIQMNMVQYIMIGLLDHLVTLEVILVVQHPPETKECPYNVSMDAWKYSNNGWTIADANDVSIECLTGNDKGKSEDEGCRKLYSVSSQQFSKNN